MRARESYRADYAAASTAGLADTMAKDRRPSTVPLLPVIIVDEDDDRHGDDNSVINDN